MERKQIDQGNIRAICQKWVHSSSGEHRYAGFSVHLTFDALARYLYLMRQDMPKAAPASYTWIDWRFPAGRIKISEALAEQIVDSGVEGVRFGMNYDYPATENDEQ